MAPMTLAQFLLVAVLVWIIFDLGRRIPPLSQLERELRQHSQHSSLRRGLERAVRFRLPVYSAETVQGKEAEFIRDRLPVKWGRTLLIMLLSFALVLAVMSWLTR
jgi:hypothetical protein